MSEQSVSAQALVDAKKELLALQEIVHQKDAEISSLHVAARQRDDDMQQLMARLDAATRDYTTIHEESRQLRDRLRQYDDTLAAECAEHNAMLNELRGESAVVERESARLALERLHKENEELRRREAESMEVVGRLMADVEAGHRSGVHLPTLAATTTTTMVTYTKEEHDADVEQQLCALRAELEELFGEDIGHMKEQMRDHYSTTVDQLQRDLARSNEERSRLADQADLWQQQYMALSQQGVSSVDIAERLNDAISDNVLQRQRVSELTAQVEQLNAAQLSARLLSQTAGVDTMSFELEEYKKEVAEKFGAESHSLHNKVDELQSMLKEASDDRDRSLARCETIEVELAAVRQELLSTRSKHTVELQQIESKAASDISQLTSQLAYAKEQLDKLKFAVIKASTTRDEVMQALHEKQSELEGVRTNCEQRVELLKAENADALQHLSTDYTKRLEAELAKYETMKKENEQLQLQSSQMPLNANVLATPFAAMWGASDVDSVVAHLSSQVEKVTRERDSAMQSLQTVYSDRIELQQTIKTLEAERNTLTTHKNQLDVERQLLGEQLAQTRSELSRLKTTSSRSIASLSSVGTGSIPNMPSVTDDVGEQGPDVIDSLRAEFEELQRLRREKDRSSSSSSGVMVTSSGINVSSQSEVNVNVKSAVMGTDSAVGQSSSLTEAEEVLKVEEMETLKQEYSALCAELVRLREMLVTLQRVDREREQVRSQFELEIRLLRDEMLRRDQAEAAAIAGTVETVLGDELKKRDTEINSLKARLATTLSRMEELITEKDQQCASYEHELEEVREEHDSALKRIDALVQEHNIILGGQVPLSTILPENVREMPIVIQSEILESVDEEVSPRQVVFENQAKEVESLRGQLHQAALNIEKLLRDRDMLNYAMESNAAELLAGLEKAVIENAEQRQMYEKKLAFYSQDIEQLNQKLDTVSAELEQAKSSHLSEMEKVREECQVQINELSFSNDESNSEQRQELVAVRKQCAELVKQLEQTTAEKLSMEQEYIIVLQDVNRENSARISALREGFEQDLAQAQVYGEHAVQLEEELNQSQQEVAQLKQNLEVYEGSGETHKHEPGDLEALQVLQLRINDLTETKDELQQQLSVLAAQNEQLSSEVEMLQLEKENLRSQVAAIPQDPVHGFSSVDADSFADTSGDSYLFYTPSKSKRTVVEKLKSMQAEKEVLTNMVDRLNAEKEQLKTHLVSGNLPSHVFEADICHLELSSPETVKSSQVGTGAEARLIALESEKELLAGMLEKLSCVNEQLIALMSPGNDNALDVSYDDYLCDINNIDDGTSTILNQSAAASDFDTLYQRTVEQMVHEQDSARSELLAIKARVSTVMDLSASANGSEQEISVDTVLTALDVLAKKVAEKTSEDTDEIVTNLKAEAEVTGQDQDSHKSALEDRDRSSSGAEAQLPSSTVSVMVSAETEHVVSEMPKSDETSDCSKKNELLESRVRELEVMRVNLLDEKEAVAEQYGKTIDELKTRLVEMQAVVESLQSELGVKSREFEAVIGDLTSRLLAAETEHRHDDEEHQQKMVVELASMRSECDEKQIIIDDLTRRLQSATDQSSTLAMESELSASRVEELHNGGISELEQLNAALSTIDVKPQTAEQGTVTEDFLFTGSTCSMQADALSMETAHSDESVTALQVRLQTVESELAAVMLEKDELSAKLSNFPDSVVKPNKDANLALLETGSEVAAVRQMQSSDATDHKEYYLHLCSRHCIAVTDVENVTEDTAAETDDAAVQTDISTERYVDDDLQVKKIDELVVAICSVKEGRDEIYRKLSLAETCIKETQDSVGAKIKDFEEKMISMREELHCSETRYKTLETEQQEAAQAWQEKIQKLSDELHMISVERDGLSAELNSAKDELEAWKKSCKEKTSFIEELQSEHAATAQTQQALSDELTACKKHLEEAASNETKLLAAREKCNVLEAMLSTAEQKQDSMKQENISSHSQLEELRLTTASMKLEIEDLEAQVVALRDENMTLTATCNAAVELKNTQAEFESELHSQIEDLEEQVRLLNGQLETAGLSLLAAEKKYDELQQSLASTAADTASKLEALNSELTSTAKEKAELTQKLADAKKIHEELKSQLESTLEERSSLVIQLRELETECMGLKKSVVGYQEALVNVESLEKECGCLKEETKCLSERCSSLELARSTVESQLDDQQQRTFDLQTANHQLMQTKESLLSENGHLKQQISDYIEKVNTFASNEQLALENWTSKEEQLLSKIKRHEADLSAMAVENGALKSEVGRIPELESEVAAISAEHNNSHRRCSELEVEIVVLRQNMEDVNKQFELTSTEQSAAMTKLTRRCEEAECEVERLNKLADEKTHCVIDLQLALAATQEELATSQKDREHLSNVLDTERNAVKQQTVAYEAAISEVKSRAEVAYSKSEQLEKELALKCEQLKVAEDQLLQLESQQKDVDNKIAANTEALRLECDELRTLVSTCQLDANFAREKLSAMEGLCHALTTERDALEKERIKLHADSDELSCRLVSLEQRIEQSEADESKAVNQHVLAGHMAMEEQQNVVDGSATSQHENQILEVGTKISSIELELETAHETISRLQVQVSSLQLENERLQQQKQAAEDSLNAVSLELASANTSQPDSATRLQQELTGEGSIRSTEGCEDLQARLVELDDLTDATDGATRLVSAHSSRTYAKLTSSDVVTVDASTQMTDDTYFPADNEVEVPPGSPSENDASSSAVHASRTYTKLAVSIDTAARQTVMEPTSARSEIDANNLYSQISHLQLELEQQKASQSRLIEQLQADCVDLAKARDKLRQENSLLNEQLKAKTTQVSTSSMVDDEMLQLSELRAEVEAEFRQHYESVMEDVETECGKKLAAMKDECDRQVAAVENCARAEVLECSPFETSTVESASSVGSDSSTQMSDIISQRDQLRSELADRTKELVELRVEIERLREDDERRKIQLAAAVTIEPPCDDDAELDPDEDQRRVITNLESQLLMSTEENERLQAKIMELEQEAERQVASELSTVRQQMEEQHVTEMKVFG